MKIAPSSTSNSKRAIDRSTLVRILFGFFIVFLTLWFIPRFFPIDALCKRGLECALLYPELEAPFRKNVSIHRESVCGDLIALSGREEFCVKRKESFETDAFGFRNTKDVTIEKSPYILLGDSFAFGQGLDQTKMPSVTLSDVLRRSVYSGAGRLDLNAILALSRRAGPGKTFIYLDLDRSERNSSQLNLTEKGTITRKWKSFRETFKNYNPFKIILTRISHFFFDRFLPKKPSPTVVSLPARNQQVEYLFLKSSVNRGRMSDTWKSDRVAYFSKLNLILKDQGQRLFVVIVPEKSTVYLDSERERATDLDELADLLDASGIQAVSLAKRYMEDMHFPKEPTDLFYFRDDTHWADIGVNIMAVEVRTGLKIPKN